jgi:CRP/FNR family nitrogen fixation transcriptional regulator
MTVHFNSQTPAARSGEYQPFGTNGQRHALSIYRANGEIFGQGEPAGSLYSVEFGCVRIGRVTLDGRRQLCGFCFAGDVFGWESEAEHQFFAEAVEESGIRVLRPGRDTEPSRALLALVLTSLRRIQDHLLALGGTKVDERFADFLCEMVERQGDDCLVRLPMPRSDIGDYLGVSFETVSRILRRLKERGIIRAPDTHSVEILDLDGLLELSRRRVN